MPKRKPNKSSASHGTTALRQSSILFTDMPRFKDSRTWNFSDKIANNYQERTYA